MPRQTLVEAVVFRNTQRHSSATYALRSSPERIIYDRIFARIPTNDRLFALFVGKPLLASTIENDMKGCIRVRRNSNAEANLSRDLENIGDVEGDLRVQMLLVGTSGQKLGVCASNRYWMKKRRREGVSSLWNSNNSKLSWHNSISSNSCKAAYSLYRRE